MKKRIGSVILTLALVLTLFPAATVPARAEATHAHSHSIKTVNTETDEITETAITGDWTALSNSISNYILSEGNYYLTESLELGENILRVSSGTVNLCLNGYDITSTHSSTMSYGAIYLSGGALNIFDDSETQGVIQNTNTGWGIYVNGSSATLNLYGGTIKGGINYGVQLNSGSFYMFDGAITDSSKGGVYVYSGTFTMIGGSITDNHASYGGGVYLSSGTFTMAGGSITGNSASYGGGVYTRSTFTMTGGSITGNSASNGGGVYLSSGGSFTMTGSAEISSNTTTDSGGGVYLSSDGTFTMKGGKISGNKVSSYGTNIDGGGVYVSGGTFEMSGASEVSGNMVSATSASALGGGIYVGTSGTVTIKDNASVKDNTAESDNSIRYAEGGGIYIDKSGSSQGKVTIQDNASITGNQAINSKASDKTHGGGVCVNGTVSGKGLCISGSPKITGNKSESSAGTANDNVYLYSSTTLITIDGALSGGASIGVTLKDGTGTFTSGYSTHNSGTEPETYFFSDTGNEIILQSNEAYLTTNTAHVHDGITFKAWPSTTSLPTTAGNYYLTDNVTLSATWSVPSGTTNLCLNGKSITLTADTGSVISFLYSGRTLNLYDESGTTDTHTIADPTGGEGATVTITGGVITGGKGYENTYKYIYGGGVYVSGGGTFHLYGGAIAGNQAQYGGGVYVLQGSFVMDGGSVCNNMASSDGNFFGGGGVCVDNGTGSGTDPLATFTMNSGVLDGNKTSGTYAGAVHASGHRTAVTMNGGTIRNHTTGAILLMSKTTFTMKDGAVIENNQGTAYNAYVIYANSSSIIMEGGTIRNNGGGYALYLLGGTFSMSGGSIVNNTRAGVYAQTGTVALSGTVTIQGNANNAYNVQSYNPIDITGLDTGASNIGLSPWSTPGSGSYSNPFVATSGTHDTWAEVPSCFHSDNSLYRLELKDGEVAVAYYRTVTFDMRGHGNNVTKEVYNGSKLTEPDNPTADGYDFGGWYKDTNYQTAWNFDEDTVGIYSNTLYAKWTKNEFTVSEIASVTYRGYEQQPTVEVTDKSDSSKTLTKDTDYTVTVTQNGVTATPKNAGTYNVTVKGINSYAAMGSVTKTYTINKAEYPANSDYSVTPKTDLVYNGQAQNLISGASRTSYGEGASGVSARLSENDSWVSAMSLKATNAGEYTVYYMAPGGTNYEDSAVKSVTVTIAKADPNPTTPTNLTATYGQTLANVTLPSVSGGVWTWNDAATSVGNVGTHSFSAIFTPTDTANYNTVERSITVNVSSASLNGLVTARGYSGTYDGEAHGITVSAPDDATVKYGSISGSYAEDASPTYKDAGTHTVYYQVTKDNYTTVIGSATVSIEQKEANLSWGTVSFTYDGAEKCPTATVSNLVGGDTCTVTVTGGITNAGSSTARATALSNPNYKLPSTNYISFSVAKATQAAPTNAPTAASTTVNSVTLTATDGYEYRRGADGTWQTSNTFTGLDMNTSYTFYQRVAENANYKPSEPSEGATISTANHVHEWEYSASGAVLTATCKDTDNGHGATKTATLTISATDTTYDGTAVTATVSGSIDGVTTPSIVYKRGDTELSEAPKDAGTYTANITLGSATASVEFTIGKAALTVTANPKTITYGDPAPAYSVSYSGWVNSEDTSALTTAPTATSAYTQYDGVNTYEITPNGGAATNYSFNYVNGTLTVGKRDVTISGITAVNKTYDGTTGATLSYDDVTFGGVVNGDELTVTATGTFADKNVGTGKTVTISGLLLGGASVGNYQLAGSGQQTDTTANITTKEITVSGITAESKVYDGDTTATLKYDGVTLTGKIDGDDLSVTATGTFDSAAKGTGKTVTISGLTLGGTDKDNYFLAETGQQTTTTANITGAATSVTTAPTASAITYGQTLADSSLTGGVGSVDGTFSWKAPSTAPAVSDSGVTEYDVTFTPTDEENYAPSTCKVKLTVSKATPTIVTAPTASEIGYGQRLVDSTLTGGAAKNPYSNADVAGTFAWTDTTTAPTKTDSNSTAYSVTFTPADTANYDTATTTVTLTVNKAARGDMTVTMAGYTYGGMPSTPSVSGNPESTTVTYYYSTVSFLSSDSDKKAPTTGTMWDTAEPPTLDAGTYFMRAVLAESANYEQYITAQTTFTVSQAQYAAPTAPAVSGYTVTIAEADRNKRLEYAVVTSGSAAPTTYTPVPALSDGAFTLKGLAQNTGYTIYLRERASANGNYKASAAVNTGWTTPTEWTVVYNANRGTGAVPATQNGTGATPVTVASGSGLSRTGYTFNGWKDGSGTTYAVGASISDGATLYAQWTANSYTVQFNANGGTGTIADESFTYDTAQALTANAFSRTGYTFAGWSTSAGGPVLYGDGQSVKNLTVFGSVMLYAVWAQNTYAVSGSVSSETNSAVTVKLMQGNAQFATQDITISGGSGSYNFTGVPAGTYNLVATQGDQTVTEIIVITDEGVTRNITMPSYKVSSVLEVKGEDTPPVVVGGLNNEAASKAEESKTVTITMTVEKQEAQQLPESATEAEQETQDAIEAIESAASASDGVEYMNITVQKEVKSGGTTESTETLTTTNTVMEIVVPYDMDGKKNIKVYRHHDGAAAPLAQTGTKADGTYQVDTENGLIYLYANQFSTYAIAYEEVGSDPVTPPSPPTPPSPSSGGTSYYTITVAGTEGGTVTTDHKTASRGATVTLTVTADDGFQLASLTVTDAVRNKISLTQTGGKYTFSMPSSNVTVTATFAPKPCAQDDTCPISAFTDADPAAWYHDGVHYVLENGIMSGYGNGLFGPDDTTSRAMMAQILWNMEGKPVVNYALSFTDVNADKWYIEAIRWATAEGIMNGYGNGLFGADDAMTREQLAAIVHRYAKYKGVDVSATSDLLGYTDLDKVSAWALPSVKWAVGSGAVGGRTNTTLNPKDNATRVEIATIVMRYCTEIAE